RKKKKKKNKNKKVYALDDKAQSFYFVPSEYMFWNKGTRDSKPGTRTHWCAVGKLLYCVGAHGSILWCEPDVLDWKEVKGLENLKKSFSGSRDVLFNPGPRLYCPPRMVKSEISRLGSNSSGNIVIFWNARLKNPDGLELCSAEISVERREGGDIWGKIEWSGALFKLGPLSHSYGEVLYSASVFV
ncbi:hypothetical protein EUTSA_v10019497mg, partial [Eutrema salsugineum]